MSITKTNYNLPEFDKSAKMREIRNSLGSAAKEGKLQHIIPFSQLVDLDESVMVFRLLIRHGYHVGSHNEGMLVKW